MSRPRQTPPWKGRNEAPSARCRGSRNFRSGRAAMKRILIVDDSADTADTFAMLLQTVGHDARTATNGSDACTVVDSFQPDVVLLDIGMPGMDGYALARLLRARPELAETMFVAL